MTRAEMISLLSAETGAEAEAELLARAASLRERTIGPGIYLRGLIELSNCCSKDCYYCGIRRSNTRVPRYELTDQQVLAAARCAWQQGYGSVVIQAGERTEPRFVARIERLVRQIKTLSDNELGITLSLGEQTQAVYRRWHRAGADRYLLRIETSNPELYARLHPSGQSFAGRLACLHALRDEGYQLGTGVMIGLPGQGFSDLADDLLFFKQLDIDMCGMGPYIGHPDTPLFHLNKSLGQFPGRSAATTGTSGEGFRLTLRMIALLRLGMPSINIAATTALHALHPTGREQGIAAGANVLMPNITPSVERGKYNLYADKPLEDTDLTPFEGRIEWGRRGDSAHFIAKSSLDFSTEGEGEGEGEGTAP